MSLLSDRFSLRLLTANDASLLSSLAIKIYRQYYTYLWNDDGAWYIEHTYNVQKVQQELSDLGNLHYAAFTGEEVVGYIKLRLNQTWKGLQSPNCLEVERIYILREAAGAGLGKRLMQAALEVAAFHNQPQVFLKAMNSSTDAIAFYQKLGFEVFDTHTLPYEQMKIELRGMVVMKRTVE